MRSRQGWVCRGRGGLAVGLASAVTVLVAATPAAALSWGSPVTVSAASELAAPATPSSAMDAAGDAVVAWTNYHDSSFDCPCQVRVALRPAGGSFGAPATLDTVT